MAPAKDYETIHYNDQLLPIAYGYERCLSPSDTTVPRPKWHEQMEFKLILSGKGEISCGSTLFLAEPGDIIAINACELHSTTPVGNETLRYHVLMLSPQLLYGDMPGQLLTPYLDGKKRFQNHIRGDAVCRHFFLTMMKEMEEQHTAYPMAVVGNFTLFLTELIRQYTEPGNPLSSSDTLSQYAKKLEPALLMIGDRYREDLTLPMLADACGLSMYHFSRIFRQVTGQPVIAYLNTYRMGKAEMLLRFTELSVSDIAAAVGYKDNSYFTRAFRKQFGLPPSEYRLKIPQDT